MLKIASSALQLFEETFGRHASHTVLAPGRVNLIGEHVDYHEGLVFPAAIDRHIAISASVAPGPSRFVSSVKGQTKHFTIRETEKRHLQSWSRYGVGMAWALRRMGIQCPEVEVSIVSNLPTGAGLSSSAAMEMAFGVLFQALTGAEISGVEMARLGQICENQFVGVPCGLMDQLASRLGKEDHALLIDIRKPEACQQIPIPKDLQIVVCDTGVKHNLGSSGYPLRRRQSEEAASRLGYLFLRDANLAEVDTLSGVLQKRARHVVSENNRVAEFAEALEKGDRRQIGSLMKASHESMRDDYEASAPEVDQMAEACWASPGCVGARITGGGFGGACVALVEIAQVDTFMSEASKKFAASAGKLGNFLACRAADGAHLV